jgi:serine protease inhibitor
MLVIAAAACADPSAPDRAPPTIAALPRALSATEEAMVGASNAFGFSLLREENPSFVGQNVFLSPLSASMALGMTMNGAAGTTFEEMRSALAFGTESHDELNQSYQSLIALLRGLDQRVDFRIANAIFYDDAFGGAVEPSFLSDAARYFDADVAGLDFASPLAVDTVNAWAGRTTSGRIPRVIEHIEPDLVMLLMNAIYFKGDWRQGFKENETHPQPFTPSSGPPLSVPTMHRTGGFRLGTTANATIVELPYGGDAFVMTILMPFSGVSVDQTIATLSAEAWDAETANLHDDDADLYLPKFTLLWEDTLNAALQRLGMKQAFVPDGADFTRLSASAGRHLFISFVKQNTFVDVNEVGTEAAAVTTVGVGITSVPQAIRVNRPFAVAIRERLTGTVLFLGKVEVPE